MRTGMYQWIAVGFVTIGMGCGQPASQAKQEAPTTAPTTAPSVAAATSSPVPPAPIETVAGKPTPEPIAEIQIPEGNPAEILDFLEKILSINPPSDDPAVVKQAFATTFRALVRGADKVLKHADANEEQKTEALRFKVSALFQGSQRGMTEFVEQLNTLAEELYKSSPKSEVTIVAESLAIKASHEKANAGLQMDALPRIERFMERFPGNTNAAGLLSEMAMAAEMAQKDEDAKKVLNLVVSKFPKSDAAKVAKGTLRRLDLVGKPMEIRGKTINGKAFDLASLKGKVILIDFWATWCGPCLAEMENLKAAYGKYHEKGFEIVGIPLDDERKPLEEFLAEKKFPWIQALPETESSDNAFARDYGIQAIPAMFLIDRNGNVVSTTVRGEMLEELLPDLLKGSTASPAAGQKAN